MGSDIKQVLVIRADIRMSRGKIAAQAAHAACLSAKEARKKCYDIWRSWLLQGGKKIVLEVNSEGELISIYEKARRAGLPCALVVDAGYTEIPPGTKTAVGIGPEESKKIDKITGHLKTLR